ncbi:hypothetical protein DRO33_02880 [Candidatus Bathyarchaeota archaeon]|nr:MAG: hypothetical protein DRO33_02880 [Candidatus Bathyarchaeota archaeon]
MVELETAMLIASVLAGFIVCFVLGWRLKKRDPAVEKVVDTIVERYLDERKFNLGDLAKETGLDRPVLERALRRLERAGVVTRVRGDTYRLKDPLVFLTERDYDRAVRITKDDNILYGAYQNPYLPRLYLLCVYGLFLADLVFAVLAYLSYTMGWPSPTISRWVLKILPPDKAEELFVPFLLFMVGMGMVFVDFLDNLIKGWARERYMVIVGALSGVSYDVSLADELSGRIRRGRIVDVDLDVSLLQKLINYFRSVPLGDVKVRYRAEEGEERTIVFRNMPFPRELFYVIRSVQLGALGWRKKYARTLMLWRARAALPSVRG